MNRLLSITILLFPSVAVLAQDQRSPIKVPHVLNRGRGTPITSYTERPPDITFVPQGPNARHGHVWVQSVSDGLLVVGEVDGDPPDFPRNKNLILEKDHIEVWLADAKDPDLPPIGWGNQFEEIILPKGAESCADWARKDSSAHAPVAEKKCQSWAETQSRYRAYFKRLFLRQWLVTPSYAVESFATPAYDEITARRLFVLDRVAIALKRLLGDSNFTTRATEIGARLREQDGLTLACDAIQSVLP